MSTGSNPGLPRVTGQLSKSEVTPDPYEVGRGGVTHSTHPGSPENYEKKEKNMTRTFVPVEQDMRGLGVRSRPVQWYVLIREMEKVRQETGMGLGAIWAHVHNEDFDNARASFERFVGRKVM